MSNTEKSTREKYDRSARYYDIMELLPESFFFTRFRRLLFSRIEGETILEVGVGTGKNIPFYPKDKKVVAIDFSEEMLKRARKRAEEIKSPVDLRLMNIQSLQFENQSFDAVISTCVFCSVPDPVKGLMEVRRVLKSGGRFYAVEHVRPTGRTLGNLFDRIAPLVESKSGVCINRDTVDNIRRAGFTVEEERDLFLDIFKLIIARPE